MLRATRRVYASLDFVRRGMRELGYLAERMGCELFLASLPFQTAAILRACAPWGRLRRELIDGNEPVRELGRQHAAWLAECGRSG